MADGENETSGDQRTARNKAHVIGPMNGTIELKYQEFHRKGASGSQLYRVNAILVKFFTKRIVTLKLFAIGLGRENILPLDTSKSG